VTDDKHQKQVELIKHDRRITQKQIAGRLGMSKKEWAISLVYLATQKSVLDGCRAC